MLFVTLDISFVETIKDLEGLVCGISQDLLILLHSFKLMESFGYLNVDPLHYGEEVLLRKLDQISLEIGPCLFVKVENVRYLLVNHGYFRLVRV